MLSVPKRVLLRMRWWFVRDKNNLIQAIKTNNDWTNEILLLAKGNFLWTLITFLCGRIKVKFGDAGPRDLRGLNLNRINFHNCNNLGDTHFECSKFTSVDFSHSQLGTSFFDFSKFVGKENNDFSYSKMHRVSFKNCMIENTIFDFSEGKEINLHNCLIRKAKFYGATWEDTLINYEFAIEPIFKMLLVSHILSIFNFRIGTKIVEIIDPPKVLTESPKMSISNILFHFNKLHNFRRNNKLFGLALYIFTDYGRNWNRFLLSILFFVFLFGFIYSGFDLPFIEMPEQKPRIFIYLSPQMDWFTPESSQCNGLCEKLTEYFRPYYFSVATFTTLGYGENKPIDWLGQVYCCVETLIGFLFLSILAAAFYMKLKELRD